MLGLKLNHVSKRGHRGRLAINMLLINSLSDIYKQDWYSRQDGSAVALLYHAFKQHLSTGIIVMFWYSKLHRTSYCLTIMSNCNFARSKQRTSGQTIFPSFWVDTDVDKGLLCCEAHVFITVQVCISFQPSSGYNNVADTICHLLTTCYILLWWPGTSPPESIFLD